MLFKFSGVGFMSVVLIDLRDAPHGGFSGFQGCGFSAIL